MKKLLLSSLILSSFSGLVYAEEAAFKPTDKELEVIKVMLKEDIQKFLNGEETPFNEEYKENESNYYDENGRVYDLKSLSETHFVALDGKKKGAK